MPQNGYASEGETPRWLMPLVIGGFLVSGMAGLMDEVVWSRALPLLIGGTTMSHTIVLATFMGGLALGNWVFGRRADWTSDALRLYALLELGVGFSCFFFPEIFAAAGRLYIVLASPLGFAHPANVPLKVGLAATSVLIPTFLMGGTLPALARVIVKDLSEVTVSISRLYTINSLGAVAGVAVGGFVLVPKLGLDWTIRLSGACNLLLAAIFLLACARLRYYRARREVHERRKIVEHPRNEVQVRRYSPLQQQMAFVVIGVAGAVSMVYEVVWTRLLTLVMGSSTFSFTIMLLTFISGITLGAWAVGRLVSERRDAMLWFAAAEIGVFVSIVPLIPLYDQLPIVFSALAGHLDRSPEMFTVYLALKIAIAFMLMLLPTFFIGMTLPLASRVAVDRLAVLGRRVGSVFSINTVGTVVGATVTGLVLIPLLELRATLELGVAMSGGLGVILLSATRVSRRVRLAVGGSVAVLLTLVLMVFPAWDQLVLHFGLYRHGQMKAESPQQVHTLLSRFRLEYAHHGVDTSVSVVRDLQTGRLYQKANGKTEAGTGYDMATQLWLGHLGMMLKPEARKVAVVGLGSGITVGAVLSHPGAEADVVEISRSVVESAEWFAPYNDDVLHNPRMSLHIGDAKEFFNLRAAEEWDVIVSQPSNPWISGVGSLFSEEYFEQIQGILRDDGLLVQWMHLYELDDELLRVTLNTLGSVFDHVEVWQCNAADIILVASSRPIVADVDAITERLREPRVLASFSRPQMGGAASDSVGFLLHQTFSADRFRALFPGRPPLNSDSRPVLEYKAPRAFFVGATTGLLQNLDERLLAAADNHTHLAAALGAGPATEAQLRSAVRELETGRGSTNVKLLRSLAWKSRWTDAEEPDGRRLFARYGDEGLAAVLESGNYTAEQRVRAWAQAIPLATSVLFVPDGSLFGAEVDRLALTSASTLGDPAVVAELWWAFYRIGDLERIEGWPQPLPEGLADDPTGWLGAPIPLSDLQDLLVGVGRVLDQGLATDRDRLLRFLKKHPGAFPVAPLVDRSASPRREGGP